MTPRPEVRPEVRPERYSASQGCVPDAVRDARPSVIGTRSAGRALAACFPRVPRVPLQPRPRACVHACALSLREREEHGTQCSVVALAGDGAPDGALALLTEGAPRREGEGAGSQPTPGVARSATAPREGRNGDVAHTSAERRPGDRRGGTRSTSPARAHRMRSPPARTAIRLDPLSTSAVHTLAPARRTHAD